MNELRTNCPKCGKPVVFYGDFAMSSICTGCGTIVRRPARGQATAGGAAEQPAKEVESPQIGDLPQGDSPLEFGMKGRYQGHDFQIRGVVRLQHDAGGFWDEWYLLFDDGRCGWLAEVQQRLFLTFLIDLRGAAKIPDFNELNVDQRFRLRAADPPLKVAEKGSGRPVAARGEIPYDLKPQADYRYADLSGPGGRFATIDYGDATPAVYYGKEVHLADLNLPHRHEDVSHDPRHVDAVQAECPHCRHRLTLFVPHKSVRVGCTSCGALLDADEGRLQFVRATAQPPKPMLPIGAQGDFSGVHYTVVGYLRRCLVSDASAAWDEYLLYNSQVGYRWLTCSDNHWNFVRTVPAGEVEAASSSVVYNGRKYEWTEQDITVAACILGEFYWKIDKGEQVWLTDFVRPPEILSREITHGGPDSGEVSWSHGTYISGDLVQRAFGLTRPLPRPRGASPNQPLSAPQIYAWWAVMVGLTLLAGIFFQVRARREQVVLQRCDLPAVNPAAATGGAPAQSVGGDFGVPGPALPADAANISGGTGSLAASGTGSAATGTDEGTIFFSDPFQVRAHENLEIQVSTLATNFWLGVDGDLVDEQSGVVQEFSIPIEYYQGVEDGEAWSEGSREGTVYISSLPAGTYVLRIVGQHEPQNIPLHFVVSVRENVAADRAPAAGAGGRVGPAGNHVARASIPTGPGKQVNHAQIHLHRSRQPGARVLCRRRVFRLGVRQSAAAGGGRRRPPLARLVAPRQRTSFLFRLSRR